MSIPPSYQGQLSGTAAAYFSRYPNEHGWDLLPNSEMPVKFYCIHCGRDTIHTYEAREPCSCQTKDIINVSPAPPSDDIRKRRRLAKSSTL